MAGYNHRRGMSNNAVDDYRKNEKPISQFTAQDLRDADVNISWALPGGWPGRNTGDTSHGTIRRNSTNSFASTTWRPCVSASKTWAPTGWPNSDSITADTWRPSGDRPARDWLQWRANTPSLPALLAGGTWWPGSLSKVNSTARDGSTCRTAPERRPAPSGSSSERPTASPAPCCIRLKSKRHSHAFCTGRRSYQPPTPTVAVDVGYAIRRPSRELTRSHCSPNSCGMSSRSTMQAHGPCETTLPLTMC